ncbi:MAG: beta-Ala-His dipeptidase [Clostridiales bacterium]|nr:beta-Ala-His dipeptidase [Clostridiales bacterium]
MLENLCPQVVFQWFEVLSAIPRGSGNMERIAAWCEDFAAKRGLEHYRDEADNIIIKKPASDAEVTQEPVILQGHLDMVCVQEDDIRIDWVRDGPKLRTDGVDVWAEGTSLGADNGIAVAMILALLDSENLKHPPLEAVLTTDEESGMNGAKALDRKLLRGRRMINLDAEEEGSIYIGSAGGNKVSCTLPLQAERAFRPSWELRVGGLRGGHSGACIHLGRANALKLMGRVLSHLQAETAIGIAEIRGGQADNAIPAEATAVITAEQSVDFVPVVEEMEKRLQQEYRITDPDLFLTIRRIPQTVAMDKESTERLITFLLCAPNGIVEMSPDVPGFPQTSVNIGVLRTSGPGAYAEFCIRSALHSQQQALNDEVRHLVQILEGGTCHNEGCPAWEVQAYSSMRETAREAYEALYGEVPRFRITHCGAECGVFADGIQGLDCIAIGPDIFHAHTTKERLSVASTERTWCFLVDILRRLVV